MLGDCKTRLKTIWRLVLVALLVAVAALASLQAFNVFALVFTFV